MKQFRTTLHIWSLAIYGGWSLTISWNTKWIFGKKMKIGIKIWARKKIGLRIYPGVRVAIQKKMK